MFSIIALLCYGISFLIDELIIKAGEIKAPGIITQTEELVWNPSSL